MLTQALEGGEAADKEREKEKMRRGMLTSSMQPMNEEMMSKLMLEIQTIKRALTI